MKTVDRMREALKVVEQASEEFRKIGFFKQGVLNRLRKWISGLPPDDRGFVDAVVRKAAAQGAGTGADFNGVVLDRESKASLESLVLHYVEQDAELFAGLEEVIEQIRSKLAPHNGPKYLGPWP